jgi:hypothetical protein
VRDDADQLVGILGLNDQAGVDEHVLAAGREGVDVVVLDDEDLDALGVQARGGEDRITVGVQRRLDLGVADELDRRPARILGEGG